VRRGAAGLVLFLAGLALPHPVLALSVLLTPEHPRPGDVVLIRVRAAPPDLAGEWNGQPLGFFPSRDGLAALAGVDLDLPVGPVAWRLFRPMAGGGRLVVAAGTVTLHGRRFETQHLTLPPGQVDLDPATLARVEREHGELKTALGETAATRLWRGAFHQPVEGGRATGGFGLRRIINHQPRSPHTGYDWAAPRGTPVLAANAGRVVLVAEHFFAGRSVVLDHGLGLFTLYFHLDEPRVAAGETVAAGQVVGTVGATGRATGAHLHFGVWLAGARVDPMALLGLVPPPDGP
jgi:hypothetical protein